MTRPCRIGVFFAALLVPASHSLGDSVLPTEITPPALDMPAVADHLLLTEVALDEVEFIEIANWTDHPIDDLDHYYLADTQDYASLPAEAALGREPRVALQDFIVRFPKAIGPDGLPAHRSLASGEVLVIAVDGAKFLSRFGFRADFEILWTDDGTANLVGPVLGQDRPTGSRKRPESIGDQAGLTNTGEHVVLFYWDGAANAVQDVDILRLGAPEPANDLRNKAQIGGQGGLSPYRHDEVPDYYSDSCDPKYLKHQWPAPSAGHSAKRISLEDGHEVQEGTGNGLTGHDETSENTRATWDVLLNYTLSEPASFSPRTPRAFVVCLDGTWRSPYKKKRRIDENDRTFRLFKPSNPLKACRAVLPLADRVHPLDPMQRVSVQQAPHYTLGVGALYAHPGRWNAAVRPFDLFFGGTRGAGFEGTIEDVYRTLAHSFVPGDRIYLLGFSRGAAQARSLARFIDLMGGFPTMGDAYFIPRFFLEYLDGRGTLDLEAVKADIEADLHADDRAQTKCLQPFAPATVRYLGVWETVLTLGKRGRPAVSGVAFHTGPAPPPAVEIARQALAIDERRYDFRPHIWAGRATESQCVEQAWFAGVHSNVGGGYVYDGLANHALHWILEGARDAGLALDWGFVNRYRGFAQDGLYKTPGFYNVLDVIKGAPRRRPIRSELLRSYLPELRPYDTSNVPLAVHESVFERLKTTQQELDNNPKYERMRGELYRPPALLDYLVAHDCDDWLGNALKEEVQSRGDGSPRLPCPVARQDVPPCAERLLGGGEAVISHP